MGSIAGHFHLDIVRSINSCTAVSSSDAYESLAHELSTGFHSDRALLQMNEGPRSLSYFIELIQLAKGQEPTGLPG